MNKRFIVGLCAVVGSILLVASVNLQRKKKQDIPDSVVSAPIVLPVVDVSPVSKTMKVKHLQLDELQIVTLFDEVSSESAQRVINELKDKAIFNDSLYLLLDSPGGSVMAGAQIISAIQSSKVKVNTVCVGICASMAAIIFEFGNKRYSVDRSILMFHPVSGGVQGNLNEMKSLLSFVDRYSKKMDMYISQRAKIDKVTWDNMIAHNIWVDSEDAIDMNLSDAVVSVDAKFNMLNGPSNYKKFKKFPLFLFEMK